MLAVLARRIQRRAYPFHEFGVDFAYVGEFDFVVAHAACGLLDEALVGRQRFDVQAEFDARVGGRAEHGKLFLRRRLR